MLEGEPDFGTLDAPAGGFRCERPSPYAGWLVAPGVVVPARCGAPNKCAYCAYQATVENAVVVALDAEQGRMPRVGMTLTTVDPQHGLDRFRKDVEQAIRALRRRARGAEYLGMVEWTTGKGVRSNGHRRVHVHLLVKNVEPEQTLALEDAVRGVWEARTGANRVEVAELRTPAGATAYLLHHHRKREQAPPPGFKGKRMRPSRGYFGQPVAELRAEARELVREKRVRRAARRLIEWESIDGAPEEAIEHELRATLAEAREHAASISFVKLNRRGEIIAARPLARAGLRSQTA